MIPFIDLAAQQSRIKPRIDAAIQQVLAHGAYVMGPEVRAFEEQLADVRRAPSHALSCGNGTDALALPLMAWDIGPGDAVFCPSFTFAATPEVIPWTGATPVFVDILPDTYNLDPGHLEAAIEAVKAKGELRPAAVIAVDLFGQPADYPRIARDLPPPRPEADRRLARRASAAPWTASTRCTGPTPRPPASSRPSRSAATATAARC